jgi:hypothetical protein
MAVSGYSGTPLIKKMGIKDGMQIQLINPPDNYFELLGEDISSKLVKSEAPDLVHLFAQKKADLEKHFYKLINQLPATTMIWISWYKKSAKIPTDITEDTIREIVLPTGWVDVKVCAVSELWSGLKIVKRISER